MYILQCMYGWFYKLLKRMCFVRKVLNMSGRLLSNLPTFHLRRNSTDFCQFCYSGLAVNMNLKVHC